MVTQFRYGSCVGSWDRVSRYIEPQLAAMTVRDGVRREFVGLSGQPSLAVAHNRILDHYAADHDGPVVLLHDDLEITDPDMEAKILVALEEPDVALVGVCGGASDASLAWWNGPTLGHQRTDSMTLDFGQRTGEAGVLEGSFLAFSPWAVRHLRYDTQYPGFHNADEVCQAARWAGRRLIVADVDTWHHTPMGFRTAGGAEAWARGEEIYQRKRLAREASTA